MKHKNYMKPTIMIVQLDQQSDILVNSVLDTNAGVQDYNVEGYSEE